MVLRSWARREALNRLAELPQRLAHTAEVAEAAQRIAWVAGSDDDLLIAAAWLHDIGYAPALTLIGFHPVDGARYLQDVGAPGRLTNLVARHSCAIVEAKHRGLEGEAQSFPDEHGVVRAALWYCDMTTSPDGQLVTLDHAWHSMSICETSSPLRTAVKRLTRSAA